jgi:uridylate kinase
MGRNIVIRLGGSLMYTDDLSLNIEVLAKLKSWYSANKDKYDAIAIVVGGGKLSRQMNEKVGEYLPKDIYKHGMSMQITQTNAFLLKGFLDDDEIFVPETLGQAYEKLIEKGKRVVVSGGLKAGWSTDMDAAVFADILGMNMVYKLTNVDFVYTDDPNKNPEAKPIKSLTWKGYISQFGVKEGVGHKPNSSYPIGPETVFFCMEKGISFFVSGGKNLMEMESLDSVFESGTYISAS